MAKIGIIGGSGMDDPNLLTNYEKLDIITPYGHPSSSVTQGKINGIEVAILARHGRKHQISPTNVNYRANIWALKSLNCTHIIATTAVGSLRNEIKPGDIVFIDQFIDHTKHRILTFHENEVVHTAMSKPFCDNLRKLFIESAKQLNITFHEKATVITIEGPRFSTVAESNMFRSWNADIINMSTVPEVILANELKIPYISIAMSTDYDCWKTDHPPVTFEEILKVMHENSEKVKSLIINTISKIK